MPITIFFWVFNDGEYDKDFEKNKNKDKFEIICGTSTEKSF